MNTFQPFVMERMQSKWENVVEYNLSESGVHPMLLHELLEMNGQTTESLANILVNYPQANGSIELRDTISALYRGAGRDNVLVTVGAAEANYNTIHTLLEPGDEAVLMTPNYMQVWGVCRNRGIKVRNLHLMEDAGWALDLAELEALVGPDTRLIAICNPNNPTGRIMTDAEIEAVITQAERVGAWILSDEVYAGAERDGASETPSLYGRYDRVIATGSMSKAYGLPGLRVGWAVGPADTIDDIWARHEYTTISATMLSNHLANIALSPAVRPQVLARTRRFIDEGYPVLEQWMANHGNTFKLYPSQAAAIAFARYNMDVNSTALIERLRDEKSVLVVPGDHFGIDGCVRISFGQPRDYLTTALDRFHELLMDVG
jgi:aspartate/methionine/tyrosine aminotransferase